MRNNGYFDGGIGQGQREIIHSGKQSELTTPIQQAVTLGTSFLWALAMLCLIILSVGPWLGVAAIAGATLPLWRLCWLWLRSLSRERQLAGGLGLVVLTVAVVAWLKWGMQAVRLIWPPVWFYRGTLIIGGAEIMPAPLWLRGLIIIVAAIMMVPVAPLAYNMLTAIINKNWAPVYSPADPAWGPFPWLWPRDEDEPEPDKTVHITVERETPGDEEEIGWGVFRGGGGTHTRDVNLFPIEPEQWENIARLAGQGVAFSESQMASRAGFTTGPHGTWRPFHKSLRDAGWLIATGNGRNAGHEPSPRFLQFLSNTEWKMAYDSQK